jgi:hypothetical protein
LVFYNDLDGNRAGVIRFDGTRWRKGKDLLKYDPAKPGRKLLTPDGAESETSPQKIKPPPGDKSSKPTGPESAPEAPEHDVPATTPPPGVQPSGPPVSTGTTDPTSPATSRRPSDPQLRIVVSDPLPDVGEDVTLRVTSRTGARLASATWNFGDGKSASGLETRHSWAASQTYEVSVLAAFTDNRTADNRTATASLRIEVVATEARTGELTVTSEGNGTGSVLSEPAGISCPGTCSARFPTGRTVTLTAVPGSSSVFTTWDGACSGTAPSCEIQVTTAGASVVAGFAAQRPRLTVEATAGGSVTGTGIACPPTCSAVFDAGQSVSLTARANTGFVLDGWAGACSGTGSCLLVMDSDKSVSAAFRDLAAPEDCVPYDPGTLEIVDLGAQGYQLKSGNIAMHLLDNLQDAQNALSVARGYNQQCFIGRGTRYLMEYWKGGAGQPGPVSPEDCISYDPANLTIVEVNDASGTWWSLRDGSHWMEAFTTESGAVRGLRVAQQTNHICFLGRDNQRSNRRDYILEYWR